MKTYKELLTEAAPKSISDLPAFLDKAGIKYNYNSKKVTINITDLEMDIYDEFDDSGGKSKLKFYSDTPEYGTAMYTKFSDLLKVIKTRIKGIK
jgi:hypothetical protein